MGGKSGGGEAAAARADEQARQARIREGTARVNSTFERQFDDSFFNKQRDNYVNYATPQLDDQRGEANKELIFAMDRGGQLDGSARASLAGELQKKYNLQRQKIQDDALNFRTSAMTNVEDARSNLVATLNATGDAQGAANSALSRAAALSQAYLVFRITLADGAQRVFRGQPSLPGENVGQGALGTGSFDVTVKGQVLRLPETREEHP